MIYNSDNSYNLTRNDIIEFIELIELIELIDVVIVINNYKIIIKK